MTETGTESGSGLDGRVAAFRFAFDRLFRRWEPTAFWVLFGGMCFIYLLPPTLTRYLPFSDLPGHLGIVGALLHRDDPASAIRQYFWIHPHFGPNSLEIGVTYALAKIVDVTVAARVFAALCVVAVPLSVLYALEVFGKNRWLVFFAFPFSYPRIMWFGFMGSSLGVSLAILSVALGWQAARAEHWKHPVLACLAIACAGLAHPFSLAVSVGLLFLTLAIGLLQSPFSWRKPANFAIFLPVLLLFWGWFSNLFASKPASPKGPGETFLEHLLSKRPKLPEYWKWMREWSLNAYRDRGVESGVLKTLAVVGLVLLAAGAVGYGLSVRRKWIEARQAGTAPARFFLDPWRRWRTWLPRQAVLPLVFLAVVAAYLTLPGSIQRPVVWWAVAQRLVTPVILFALLLVPASLPRTLAPLLVLPVVAAAAYYGVFLARDFKTHFNDVEMKGIREAVMHIPKGRRVMALYDDREDHYAHFPLHFGGCYYTAIRGGMVLPFPVAPGYRKLSWAYPKRVTPGPPWGKVSFFNYRSHGRHYDYFLIKRHRTRKTRWNRFPSGCVKIRGHFGLWTVVQRLKKPGC